MSDSFATLRTVASQAPLSMAFPRQEYWNGLPFSSPDYLPYPVIEPLSPALAGGLFLAVLGLKLLPGLSLKWRQEFLIVAPSVVAEYSSRAGGFEWLPGSGLCSGGSQILEHRL